VRREKWQIACDQPHCRNTAQAPDDTPDALAVFQRCGWFVTRSHTGDICPACLHHGAQPAPGVRAYRRIRPRPLPTVITRIPKETSCTA
jgi:hypothetical protein